MIPSVATKRHKNIKEITLISQKVSVGDISLNINPLHAIGHFLYPLKTETEA